VVERVYVRVLTANTNLKKEKSPINLSGIFLSHYSRIIYYSILYGYSDLFYKRKRAMPTGIALFL